MKISKIILKIYSGGSVVSKYEYSPKECFVQDGSVIAKDARILLVYPTGRTTVEYIWDEAEGEKKV